MVSVASWAVKEVRSELHDESNVLVCRLSLHSDINRTSVFAGSWSMKVSLAKRFPPSLLSKTSEKRAINQPRSMKSQLRVLPR